MSNAREELLARQKACVAVLKDLQETLKEEGLEADEEHVSVSAIAIQLYVTAHSMKQEYWSASYLMADRFCHFAGVDGNEMEKLAMSLVAMERGEN